MEVKINTNGIIKSQDEYNGWLIFIEGDPEDPGDYLILLKENIPGGKGYDDWVEKYEDLSHYLEESNWVIEWTDEK